MFCLFYAAIYYVFPRRSVHLVFENNAKPARRNAIFFDNRVKVYAVRVMTCNVIYKLRYVIGA